jgi:phenylpropionate dioxygenase-like ring-hydroxylating dioxygenase large terminal subunit
VGIPSSSRIVLPSAVVNGSARSYERISTAGPYSLLIATETLPWSWYTDPEVLRVEQERIFRRSWQYAGHLGQLEEPGARFPARAGDVPVLVVRGDDGEVRAFLNVCRHRGSVLVEEPGRSATIQCRYHAWTYGLDGALRSAPRADEGLEQDGLGLRPLQVATHGPLVFVNPDLEAPPLAALPDVELEGLRFHARLPYALGANWKVALENYLECYHCPVAHKSFSAAVETSPDTYRLEDGGDRWSQYSVARGGDGQAQFHLLWPTTKLNVFPGPANLSIGPLHPDGPERCSGFLDYFFSEDVSESDIRDLLELDDEVGREDRALVESVQRGVGSGLLESGQLLPASEVLVAGFQRRIAAALGDAANR